MKVMRWLLVTAMALLLVGCEPAEYRLEVRSPRRVAESIALVVPPVNAELVEPLLETVLGNGWRVRRATGSDGVHLSFRRHRQPVKEQGLELTRTVTGPLRLRYEYRLTMANPLGRLGDNAFLKAALANQQLALAVRVVMPGGVVTEGDSSPGSVAADGAGVWTYQLQDLAAKPALTLVAISRPWRFGLLLLWALVALLLLYLVGPELLPTPEKRRAAADRRAAKAAAKAERDAKRATKAKPAKEPRAARPPREPKARRGRKGEPEPLPLPPEPPEVEAAATELGAAPEPAPTLVAGPVPPPVAEQAEAVEPVPEPVPEPVAAPARPPVADDAAASNQGRRLLWRRRRSLIRQRRKRRGRVRRRP